ncbi:MAG: iron-sulfur cluster assembly accessory protein, partial [Pseudomonadota bacterium]
MSITLTPSAAKRVTDFLDKRGTGVGLRLGVKRTGCSGFAYVINFADEVTDDDVTFDDQGVTIVVDRDALPLLDGTEVDFAKQGI